ncbi:MAG TPA: peroxiredoxin [Flavobacteriales bacterium]|nr:peroxiredoxin [Flavobacteriales bacterium]
MQTLPMLKAGELAPDFEMADQNERAIRLSDYKGKKNVVLFFYPKDFSPVCTLEACCFRDQYELFQSLDTEVIGVSADGVISHAHFAAKYDLPFPLLSDEGDLRSLYSISKTLGFVHGRITFVIDKKGVIIEVIASVFDATRHVEDALNRVRTEENQLRKD